MRFVWDREKSRANQRKHHVSFETACEAFSDPLHRSILDRVVDGEQRWQTIGMVAGLVMLIVAHTYRDDGDEEVVRIISARKATRKATRKERRGYEDG
jgi:uncharacterized DUF497 family protein